ncbi:cysteine proteinase [Auriscalpium vulgare]|uniref:Cysteine proteinase n=1 Tax=Auriscalpium vulgare TaxID=40419 RepID=A0ACB8RFR5_9AGAM|nr:cysteine proteinase [Auriscalpium vulgare]
MPSVSVLPASPALAGFGPSFSPNSPLPNGSARPLDDMSVAEIKEKAIAHSQRVSKGVSAMSLIRSAKVQIHLAQSFEQAGDLKSALSAFTKAASLTQVFMDTADFKAENLPGKRGVLWKEFVDFQQHEGSDLTRRAHALESRLNQLDKPATQPNGQDTAAADSGVQKTSGGSIADRMRSLQDAGLSVSTSKRISREIPSMAIPLSPTTSSPDGTRTIRSTMQTFGLSSPTVTHSASVSSLMGSPPASASSSLPPLQQPSHAFVSPSTLSPPSPTSSTSSSPLTTSFGTFEFAQTFPSIDELEEMPLPVADTGASSSSRRSGVRFPVLPVDPGPRPSSTPITPAVDHFASRPSSPSKLVHSPALRFRPSRSPLMPHMPVPPAVDLPTKNTVEPRQIYDYMYTHELKVLVLDVRPREAFDEEHIRGDAVVCIEPSVLLRDNVSGQTIEDSLTVAPRHEWVLFCNRDKFDLIAIYDNSSETFGSLESPLSSLVRAIYETAFRKILKKFPILIVGGLEAWKRELGDSQVVHGQNDSASTTFTAQAPSSGVDAYTSPPTTPHVDSFRTPQIAPRSPLPLRHRPGTESLSSLAAAKPLIFPSDEQQRPHLDALPGPSSTPDTNGILPQEPARRLQRKPTMTRQPSISSMNSFSRTHSDSISSPPIPQSMTNGIQYPQFAKTAMSPNLTGGSSSFNSSGGNYGITPPQASIHPSPIARRRSTFIDQSQEALAGYGTRTPIDYPDLSSQHILRPPPVAASPGQERKERPRLSQHTHSFSVPSTVGPPPPTIPSDYPVTYWADVQIGTSGLKNLGNTCYMNATIQCLSATVPFARFFTDGRWKSAVNMVNPLGTKGNLAFAFASILHEMWHEEMPYISPYPFRKSICLHAAQFGGSEQHDSQEFLSFLLDGLHEDLNRILQKPNNEVSTAREEELEKLPQQIASEQEWKIYRMRNDSLIVDFFQGQFRNRLECMTCHATSTTYNTFMYLSLPIPASKHSKLTLQHCLDAFVKEEVMEKTDAWNCPKCKALRKATKQLSLSRLPPVLLIHLKRFSFKGPFTDKIEKLIDFPLKGLDLTSYLPPPLPAGVDRGHLGMQTLGADDPRLQIPPYKYDLYGVTNHFGSLSSGHYTAFISSRGGWLYCDDSRVTPSSAKEVVGKPAYVLYYKRVKA